MARPSHAPRWVAETRFSGVIAELALPRVTVRDMLPPDLVLERRRGTARTYPLLTMFGEQTGSAVHMASMKVHTGVRFHEALFGIRCVVAQSRMPVLFIPLMYCDEPVSAWSGNALYGFNKQPATLEWLGRSFVVTGQGVGGRGVLLDMLVCDAPVSRAVTRPTAGILRLLSRPIIGRRADGSFVVSRFDLDLGRAAVRAARCTIAVGGGVLPTTEQLPLTLDDHRCLRIEDAGWCITWPQARPIDVPGLGSVA